MNSDVSLSNRVVRVFDPPILSSLEKKDIDSFINERRRYIKHVEAQALEENRTITKVSIVQSLPADLLETLAFFHFDKKTEDVVDSDLEAYFKSVLSFDDERLIPDLKSEVFDNVQMNMRLEPVARVTDVFKQFRLVLVQHGLVDYMEDKVDECVTMLLPVMRPQGVREHLRSRRMLKPKDYDSMPKFYKEAVRISEQIEKYNHRLPKRNDDKQETKFEKKGYFNRRNSQQSTTMMNKTKSLQKQPGNFPPEKGKALPSSRIPAPNQGNLPKRDSNVSQRTRSKVPQGATTVKKLVCWNCQGPHHLTKCPANLTAEQQQEIVKKHYAIMKSCGFNLPDDFEAQALQTIDENRTDAQESKAEEKKIDSPKQESTQPAFLDLSELYTGLPIVQEGDTEQKDQYDSDSERSDVSLERFWLKRVANHLPQGKTLRVSGVIDWRYCLDSGSSPVAVPRTLIEALKASNIEVYETPLKKRVEVELATATAKCIAHSTCLLDFVLDTKGGPLALRQQVCLIIEEHMHEVLLGDHLLKSLGIDVDRQLADIASKATTVTDTVALKSFLQQKSSYDNVMKLRATSVESQQSEDINCSELSDVEDPVSAFMDVASTVTLESALNNLVVEAKNNGLSPSGVDKLRTLLNSYKDIWRVDLTDMNEPAKVPPMKVDIMDNVTPYRCKARRYPPLHRDYMHQIMQSMQKGGFMYRNNSAKWAMNALVIEKDRIPQRVVGDYKPVNKVTVKTTWPMPHISSVVNHLQDMCYFFVLDLFKGYWQFPLHPDSQEYFSIMTHEGVFTPTRVPMGASGAGDYFQATVTNMFKDLLFASVLIWFDDVFGFAKTESKLLDVLTQIFAICRTYNVKLNAKKCKLFDTKMKWCGRIYTKDGVNHDPEKYTALDRAGVPQTAGDLQQALCAMNWMRSHLPRYNDIVAPLQCFLEVIYQQLGSRKKRVIKSKALSKFGWTSHHTDAWHQCMNMLKNSVKLAYPDDTKALCIFTDASDSHWSAVVTQIPHDQFSKSFEAQQHQPLLFLSGNFKGASSRWAIVEKEAFPILQVVTKADYLVRRPDGFHLFTDHRNLCYIFDPKATNPLAGKHTASRLERWAMRLIGLRYTIEFIPGDKNVFADLLTRWGAPAPTVVLKSILFIEKKPRYLQQDAFVWPTEEEISSLQERYLSMKPANAVRQIESGLWRVNDRIWIPGGENLDMRQRLLIIAHAGISGHRGQYATEKILSSVYFWKGMKDDVADFVRACLHCLSVKGGRKVPRPWGSTMHATKPNQMIWFDYLYIGDSAEGYTYIFVIRCAFSGYVELIPARNADARTAARGILDWFKRFGLVFVWGSDRGSHFLNLVMEEICHLLGVKHHFVTPYTPWANALVERPNREILAAFRILCSELRMELKYWPALVPCVQLVLVQSPRKRLGGAASITAMTGLPPTPILQFCSLIEVEEKLTVLQIKDQQMDSVKEIARVIDKQHDQMLKLIEQRRVLSIKGRSVKGIKANFQVGGYVLVAQPERYRASKLSVIFRGPFRVVEVVSEWIYKVEHLITKQMREVHATRMRFYADDKLNVSEDFLLHLQHQDAIFEVHSILRHRVVRSSVGPQVEFLVHWRAFDALEDSWEPSRTLLEDVPDLVRAYCLAHPHQPALQALI